MSTDNVTPINKAKPFKRGDGRKKGRPPGAQNVSRHRSARDGKAHSKDDVNRRDRL
jgi:hypothetical protein